MSKLISKARAGVTLVELLVVILIVTILSVSMLPLLQPFVTESQYAAEAIPVIGNLRTKIGVYQYDKGHLPGMTNATLTANTWVQTWIAGAGVDTTDDSGNPTTVTDIEKFGMGYYIIGTGGAGITAMPTANAADHVGVQIDVDYEDLKGKRSKPSHYQYYVISGDKNPSYVVGCFGNGQGLKAGTGYAVCELNFTKAQKKYIGTWKRYKSIDDDPGQIQFGKTAASDAATKLSYCYVPDATTFETLLPADGETGEPAVIQNMKRSGWEF